MRRHRQRPHDLEHFVTVDAAVQPVLMLDDRDITRTEIVDRAGHGCDDVVLDLGHHQRARRTRTVGNPHHADRTTTRHERVAQRGSERRQATRRGWKRAQDPIRQRGAARLEQMDELSWQGTRADSSTRLSRDGEPARGDSKGLTAVQPK